MKVDLLYSIMNYLDNFLPVDISKKYSENEIAEVRCFIKIFISLGGELVKENGEIFISEEFKKIIIYEYFIYIPMFNIRYKQKQKVKKVIIGGSFSPMLCCDGDLEKMIKKAKDLSNLEKGILCNYKEPYPGFYSNMNPWSRKKQKPKKGRKNGRI